MFCVQILFAKNDVTILENHIFISGYQSANPQELKTFYQTSLKTKELSKPNNLLLSSPAYINAAIGNSSSSSNSSNKNIPKKNNAKNNNKEDKKKEDNETLLPSLPGPKNSKLISGRGLPNCFFSKFTLKREDFGRYAGTKEQPGSFDKFFAMANTPRLASKRKGEQGFIFVDRWEKDKNGKLFHATGMFKVIGKHGDERVFCSEKVIDGKTVYISRGFNPDAHN